MSGVDVAVGRCHAGLRGEAPLQLQQPEPVAEPEAVAEPRPVAEEAKQSPPGPEVGRDAAIAEIEKLGGTV